MAKDLKYKATLDTSNFKKGMEESMNQTKKLEDSLGGLSKKIAEGVSIERLAEKAFDSILEFGKGVIEATANYEKFSARLSTLLGGNKDEAEALHTQLVELSSTSGIKLSDLEESTIQLNLFGVAAGKTKELLERFGNISVATGIDTKTLSEQYGRIVEGGSLTSRTLRIFQKEGINLQAELQRQLGLSTEAFDKLLKKGKITAEEVDKAFEDMTTGSGKFAGQIDEYGKTINGQLNKLSTGWEELKINIGKSQTGILSSTLGFFDKMLGYANDYLESKNNINNIFKNAGLGGANEQEVGAQGRIEQIIKSATSDKDSFGNNLSKQNQQMNIADAAKSFHTLYKEDIDIISHRLNPGKYMETLADKIEGKRLERLGEGKSTSDLQREALQFKGAFDKLNTSYNINQKPGDKTNLSTVSTPEEKEKVKENITINIGKLVERLELHTVTLKEGTDEIQRIIADAIQQAVYGIKLNYK